VHKKLDAGKFELPKATRVGDQHVVVSDAIFEVIYKGVSVRSPASMRRKRSTDPICRAARIRAGRSPVPSRRRDGERAERSVEFVGA